MLDEVDKIRKSVNQGHWDLIKNA